MRHNMHHHVRPHLQDLVANSSHINVLGAGGLRDLYFEFPLCRADPSSILATDYWRVEPVALEWSGMPLRDGLHVRIKHVVSGAVLVRHAGDHELLYLLWL